MARDPARFWRFTTAIAGYVAILEAMALALLALALSHAWI